MLGADAERLMRWNMNAYAMRGENAEARSNNNNNTKSNVPKDQCLNHRRKKKIIFFFACGRKRTKLILTNNNSMIFLSLCFFFVCVDVVDIFDRCRWEENKQGTRIRFEIYQICFKRAYTRPHCDCGESGKICPSFFSTLDLVGLLLFSSISLWFIIFDKLSVYEERKENPFFFVSSQFLNVIAWHFMNSNINVNCFTW